MFDELKPEHVIETLQLKKNTILWKKLRDYCPELEYRDRPKDREFFFNILNTINKKCMEPIVFNAVA